MRSSYNQDDVTILLKDITGFIEPLPTEEREKWIQNGTHYCEMLPFEYQPTPSYMETYQIALKNYAKQTADAVAVVSEKIFKSKGKQTVLVSLARAGTPIGILIKHYLYYKYHVVIPHYTISIIRGRGIDHNAMKYLLNQYRPEQIQFVDGWIGKGAILSVLKEAMLLYPSVSSELAVLADPANITDLCGTHEDILIPSSCLNSTVSGLISRTVLRNDLISPDDFHGAVYYKKLLSEDVTYHFIRAIEQQFDYSIEERNLSKGRSGIEEIREIAIHFSVENLNFIKPGIGETTRVLLRRVPWKILMNQTCQKDPALLHIYRLAQEKHVNVIPYPLQNYKACGIIKKYSDT